MSRAHMNASDYSIPGKVAIANGKHVSLKLTPGMPRQVQRKLKRLSRQFPKFGAALARNNSADTSGNHGLEMNSLRIGEVLETVMQNNLAAQRDNPDKVPVPLCIWGTHGLGKTTSVRDIAKKHGWKYAYVAPAQFEEMGDLHGMPRRTQLRDARGNLVIDPATGEPVEVTKYAPPEWVPREKGPGILLVDDFNRADDRILRGLMQLFQDGELSGWKLPPGWMIVATANPSGGDYSVTPIDAAMLTRMLHVTMVFDNDEWLNYARSRNMDPRAISFMTVHGKALGKDMSGKTTPRSLALMFDQLKYLPDWAGKDFEMVNVIAKSALDDNAAQIFLSWVGTMASTALPTGKDILNARDWPKMEERIKRLVTDTDGVTILSDRLAGINDDLEYYLKEQDAKEIPFTDLEKQNAENYLMMGFAKKPDGSWDESSTSWVPKEYRRGAYSFMSSKGKSSSLLSEDMVNRCMVRMRKAFR